WPLPSMALLALTLALLAITVATPAYAALSLDMSPLSFDDQYRGCGPAMRAALPALNRSEFQNNFLFAQTWPKAVAKWQKKKSLPSSVSSAQAIAIMAYTMDDLYEEFNNQGRGAGVSRQHYRDNFHFKTLHFLLTDALAALRAHEGQKCRCVHRGVKKSFKAKVGDIVRFGQFASSSLCKDVARGFGETTLFKVWTCHGAYIEEFSQFPVEEEVLIPPFEKFKVTNVIQKWGKVEIQLNSTGTYSKYNCEWVTGGDSLGT
ncbi:NARE ribosyltransferase, partial [Toxostoma redivivum]|nr:NARE ribosyltransferase [Toxostoma redivivum]